MDNDSRKEIETLLFITDQPLPLARLCQVTGREAAEVSSTLEDLRREYEERGAALQVLEIAGGWQLATRPGFAPVVRKLYTDKMVMRLSSAALETLSIIAYKQPLTRAEVEEIRGVEVIAALETLLEKNLVKVVGRKETVGRPLLYGTTPEFLRHFGLRGVEDLPPIDAFQAPAPAPEGSAPQGPFAAAGEAVPAPQEPPVPAEAGPEEGSR